MWLISWRGVWKKIIMSTQSGTSKYDIHTQGVWIISPSCDLCLSPTHYFFPGVTKHFPTKSDIYIYLFWKKIGTNEVLAFWEGLLEATTFFPFLSAGKKRVHLKTSKQAIFPGNYDTSSFFRPGLVDDS